MFLFDFPLYSIYNIVMEEYKPINNEKKFCKINQIWNKCHLLFVSSNSGTGKTTFFKWLLIRKALKGKLKFDVFFRFENEIELKFNNDAFLKPPLNASKRLLKIANKVEIICEKDNYFLINKQTKEKLAQALAVNIQKKYKSTENSIYTDCAIFDEVMPDDNNYCSNEVYKFSRLIDTRARHRNYKVICLYNNTQPFFPYKESFEKAGGVFIDFVGKKWGQKKLSGIQEILSKSDYGEVYNNNNYQFYKEFYVDCDCKNKETVCYLSIQNLLFSVKNMGEIFLLVPAKKIKKTKEVFSLSMQENNFEIIDSQLAQFLQLALNQRRVFVNRKKYTIFVKILADYLNLSYNL